METKCKPHRARPGSYQTEVAQLWMHYHDKTLPHLGYLIPNCKTEMCTEIEHLTVVTVKALSYPKGVCVYCGNPAGTRDHILPKTWTSEAARRGVLTVPACGECNSAIGDAYAPSITERRKIAQKYIQRRYRRVLRMIEPTPEELDEYGPGLRAYIVQGMTEREMIRDRLSWPPFGYDERAAERSGIDPWESGLIHG